MAGTLEAYLLALTNTMGQGIQAIPVSTSSGGTMTSGATETFDAVLGTYQWNAVAGRRYMVFVNNLLGGATVTGDLYELRVRNSGSSSAPTTSSTVVAFTQWYCPVNGGPGQTGIQLQGSFLAPTSGTNTIQMSAQRVAGTGVFTPVSGAFTREMFVVDLGVF